MAARAVGPVGTTSIAPSSPHTASCVVALEACAGSHYWAREFGKLGHTVRLIPPAYVKPFVKRQKNDTADAEAICEAAQRPTMRFVPVKGEEQQASGVVFRVRDMLVHQRTQCINALRGHMAEYGHVFPVGVMHVGTLIARVDDPESDLPAGARMVLQVLIGTLTALQAQIKELDVEINRRAKADPVAKRLMTIPGIGPIAATAITALVPAAEGFAAGRDFAAWLGLTPLQKSTGGKQKLRRDFEARGADDPAPAHSWRERRDPSGLHPGGARRLMAGPDVAAQAEDAGDGSAGEQDSSYRLGLAGQRRRVSSSCPGCVGELGP